MKAEIQKTLEFIGVSEVDASITTKYQSAINNVLPKVIGDFYEHLFRFGHDKYFTGVQVERLKARQLEHWRHLFRVDLDDVYANHVTRIGVVHRDRAVTPKVYMQSYGWITSRLTGELMSDPDVEPADRPSLVTAVLKLVHLDMTLALASYEAALLD